MIRTFVCFISEFLYRCLEIFDAFVIVSKKFTRSLEFRKGWKQWLHNPKTPVKLWIHGASVGELEDLASLFLDPQKLKEAGLVPEDVMITASSVSAAQKLSFWGREFPFAYCGPIPPEKASECRAFFDSLKPQKLLLSHTDVWPVLMNLAAKRLPHGLLWLPPKSTPPSLLKRIFLIPWLKTYLLRFSDWKSPWPSAFVGNPRIDRILSRIEAKEISNKLHILEAFGAAPQKNKFNLIIGSAWFEDLETTSQALSLLSLEQKTHWNVVAIPHDPQDSHEVARMKQVFPNAQIILEEGILLESYEGFDLAVVGGGFRTGLHNVVEPALWKIPTLCGPLLEKQPDAPWLTDLGQLLPIHNVEEMAEELKRLSSSEYHKKRKAKACEAYEKLLHHKGSISRLTKIL